MLKHCIKTMCGNKGEGLVNIPPPPLPYIASDNDVMMRARAQSMHGLVGYNVIKHVHRA